MVRGRETVILESSCRMDPAAALRGLAKGGLPPALRPPFGLLEVREPHESLAPRLKHIGRLIVEPVGYGPHCPHVLGHVLADHPVAARRAPREPPVLVAKRDREPVYLELGDVAGLLIRPEKPPDAGVPLPQVLGLAGVG